MPSAYPRSIDQQPQLASKVIQDSTDAVLATIETIRKADPDTAMDISISMQQTLTKEADREVFQNVRAVQISITKRNTLPYVYPMTALLILGALAILAILVAVCVS